jgi:hypothetical protein
MAKAADKEMEIGGIRLLEKSGGKSGDYASQGKSELMALLPVSDALDRLLSLHR